VGFVPNTIEEGMLDSGKDAFFMSNIKLFTKMENNNNNPQSMHLTPTTSRDREVAQTLLSITSEWGLGREARTASPFLRVRTRLECPENNLRELM
jgi:hypothetical protein